MALTLKQTCFNIWKSNYDRKGIGPEFKPIFTRFIGVDDTSEYNDILKTYKTKMEESNKGIVFDNEIPMSAEFSLIENVKNELKTMDVTRITSENIRLYQDDALNDIFIGALNYVVNKAIQKENFPNNNIRDNFITKLVVWAYAHILKPGIEISNDVAPKCFYYGNISRHEIYFLMMLHVMTFDVIYVNPLKNDLIWDEIDTEKLSTLVSSKQILTVESLREKTQNASVIDYVESQTLQFERELEETLFTGTGVFRPWQFRDGQVRSLFMNTSVIDLKQNWNEAARVRQGFKVEGSTVVVPNLFHQVDGMYKDAGEYYELVHTCTESENTLFVCSKEQNTLISNIPPENERLKLTFCLRGDRTFDIDKIKALPFYRYAKYRDGAEDLLLNAVNEIVRNNKIFKFEITKEMAINLMVIALSMNEKLVRLIDNFDYPESIPKLTIFLEKEDILEDDIVILVGLLSMVGFDIAIFSPSGMECSDVLNPNKVNRTRLDTMSYDSTYKGLKPPRRGIFKIFK